MTIDGPSVVVRRILQTAFDASLDGMADPSRDEIDKWDSLTHIEIVFMLEEQFDTRFSEEEIVELDSLSKIVTVLSDKHAP